jgi:cytochrome b pre-mRNA-processing protein 3
VKIQQWFGLRADPNQATVDALYERIVAAARQPHFYSQLGVSDSPLGRFEMIGMHLFLFLHRVKGEQGTVATVAQELTDEFFKDVDSSMRELGYGDGSVPKRVKNLAKMFYGRIGAYGDALDRDDDPALLDAVTRNMGPVGAPKLSAPEIVAYMKAAVAGLRGQSTERILAGELVFPDVSNARP